jgi:signal peptidase I
LDTPLNDSSTAIPNITYKRPTLKRRGFLREILETIFLVAAIYALVNLATVRFVVEGPSMQPNFHTGQVLMISRVNYLFANPARGEVAVFNPPNEPPDEPPYIKRVIGLPGETVEIRNTEVFINGQQLYEPYINEPCLPSSCRDNVWQLGPNEYFFMGDNRNHSQDSRSFGPVAREAIIGETVIRYWPISDVGFVGHIRFPDDPFELP